MKQSYMTPKQIAKAEQNEQIAARYKQLRESGASPWQAADRISNEDISIRATHMSGIQIRRILIGMGVFE